MIIVLFGLLAGIISGMGIGGGAILIPALVFLMAMDQQQAQNINLIYFIPTATIALIIHIKNKKVELKYVIPIVLYGVLGAIGGSYLAINMRQELLQKIFGGFLLIMGILELFKVRNTKDDVQSKELRN